MTINKSYIRKIISNFKTYCNHKYPHSIEKSALWDYVSGYTSSLNDILRFYDIPDDISKVSNSLINETVKETITNLDNAFDSEFASTGIIDVYRTIRQETLKNAYEITIDNIDDYIGKTISDCAYMSTSSECISPWTGEAKWLDDKIVLHITSASPINYLDINKIFDRTEIDSYAQKEYLLPRNLKLEIKSYTYMPGVVKYDKKKCICFIDVQIINKKINESKIEVQIINKKINKFKNMKNNKKALYESIMSNVSKQVKKALNEEYMSEDISIQEAADEWCSVIETYLWDHVTGIQSNAPGTLALFATLVYLDQLDDEEIKEIAERIMEQIDEDDEYDNPPVDEAFHVAVIDKLKDVASDWCADVINEWKLNQ